MPKRTQQQTNPIQECLMSGNSIWPLPRFEEIEWTQFRFREMKGANGVSPSVTMNRLHTLTDATHEIWLSTISFGVLVAIPWHNKRLNSFGVTRDDGFSSLSISYSLCHSSISVNVAIFNLLLIHRPIRDNTSSSINNYTIKWTSSTVINYCLSRQGLWVTYSLEVRHTLWLIDSPNINLLL